MSLLLARPLQMLEAAELLHLHHSVGLVLVLVFFHFYYGLFNFK